MTSFMNDLAGNISNTIGSGIGNAVNGVNNFFWKAQPTAQATQAMPQSPMSLGIKSPVPMIPLSNQQNPAIRSPIPNSQAVYKPIAPSQFENTMSAVGNNINQGKQNIQAWGNMFGMGAQPQQVARIPVQQPQPTIHQVIGSISKRFGSPEVQAPTPTPAPQRPQGQPNITIPYSQTGQPYQVPSPIAQILLNAFNDIGQATNSAKILNHPRQITAVGNEQDQGINTRPNYGENAGFRTSNIDAPNSDGSIDRGLFRINNNTFNGMMQHPYWGKIAREKFGINSWDDMEDPQKNAYMAKMIYERGGWGRWFAGDQGLRAQGAPDMGSLAKLVKQ